MKNVEEDIDRITSGKDTGNMYYQTITGLKEALFMTHPSPAEKQHLQEQNLKQDSAIDPAGHFNLHDSGLQNGMNEDDDDDDDDDDGDDDDDDEENSSDREGQGSAPGNGTQAPVDKRAARKENKKKVKEEKREARKTKVPKAVKKKKKKLAKAKKYR